MASPQKRASEPPSTPIISGMPDPETALKELENAEPLPEDPNNPNPLAHEEYVFTIDHTDGAGVRRKGEFKNAILTIEQRLNTSLLQARLTRGITWEALDPDGQWLATVMAHLTISLKEKPQWFKVNELRDVKILNLVYAEVAKHEAYFRGERPAQEAGDV